MSTANSTAPEQLQAEVKSLRKPEPRRFFVFLVEHRGVLLIPSDQRRIRDNFPSHILL
jgi:hypothetical protein